MKKYCISTLVAAFFCLLMYSQDPSLSYSMFNLNSVNPAYAGSSEQVCWSLINRQDFFGLGDISPGVIAANIHTPFNLFNRSHGVGFTVISDRQPMINSLISNLSYAYKIDAGSGKLALGINLGIYNLSSKDLSNLKSPDGNWSQDPLNPLFGLTNASDYNRIIFDMGFGLFYKTEELYAGVSSTHILKPKYSAENQTAQVPRQYYIIAGYKMPLANPLLVFKPSVLAASAGAFTKAEITGLLEYNKKLWGGVSYRTGAAVIALAGLNLFGPIDLGVAYDLGTNPLGSTYGTGSYEIMIKGCFNLKVEKKTQQYKSIRFL